MITGFVSEAVKVGGAQPPIMANGMYSLGVMAAVAVVSNSISAIPFRTYEVMPIAQGIDIHERGEVRSFILRSAREAGIDPAMAVFIFERENGFRPEVIDGRVLGDTDIPCGESKSPIYGKMQRSRGAWQINECFNWEVSDEEAFDLERSTRWAMRVMRDHPERWTPYGEYIKMRK